MQQKDLAVVRHYVDDADDTSLERGKIHMLTCGFIIEEDDDGITLATEWSTNGEVVNDEFMPSKMKKVRLTNKEIVSINYYEYW